MVEKPDIRRHVVAGLSEYDRAGAALLLAAAEIDAERFEAAVPHLEECTVHLDGTVDEIREGMEWARKGVETGLIKTAEDALDDGDGSYRRRGERLFEHLRRTGELEGLFLDDPALWNHLETAALANDPFAGYLRFASYVTRVRNQVDGLRHDVERDEPPTHVQNAAWRATTLYVRTKNLVQMLEYVNRDTRPL